MKASRRWKILQVGKFYPPHRGGMETHLQDLCERLMDHADLEVLVAHDRKDTFDEVVKGVPVTRLATALTLARTSFCPEMVGRIRSSKADIIHIHLPNPAAVMAYLASGNRARLVCTYHSDLVRQKLLGPMFEPVLRKAMSRSSAILVSSPNYVSSSPTLRQFRDRCHVVPFGVETAPPPSAAVLDRIRKTHGERVVLGVGRLVYYKGFEHIIRAMSGIDGRLCLVGSGPLQEPLKALAQSCGVTEKVAFLGNLEEDELHAIYHAADIFVLPSVARSEAFGIVQVEAMAAGKPVVNTQIDSGVPFVSLDGVTGITVPPADSGALASAVNTLLASPELRTRMGQAGKQRARQEFSTGVMMSRVLSVYERVMNGPRGTPVRPLAEPETDSRCDYAAAGEPSKKHL